MNDIVLQYKPGTWSLLIQWNPEASVHRQIAGVFFSCNISILSYWVAFTYWHYLIDIDSDVVLVLVGSGDIDVLMGAPSSHLMPLHSINNLYSLSFKPCRSFFLIFCKCDWNENPYNLALHILGIYEEKSFWIHSIE